MSKYIIELDENAKKVVAISLEDGIMWTDETEVENLEELNSDYINEHFGQFQDEAYKRGFEDGSIDVKERVDGAYQKGFEDGKAIHDKGCEGCKYQANRELTCPCSECANNYKNQWKAKQTDDEIKVGDEVRWGMDLIVITRLYMDGGFKWCDGISKDGRAFHVLEESVSKTNRHFDIEGILREMDK